MADMLVLQVKATLKYGDLMGEGDMVCSAAFDRDDEFFATAGVSKRIKVTIAVSAKLNPTSPFKTMTISTARSLFWLHLTVSYVHRTFMRRSA